jgi:hypothetical protein
MAHDLIFGETKRDFGRGSVGAGTPENTTLREVLASTKKDVKEGAARGVAPVQKVLGITSRRGLVKAGVVTALGIGVWVALTPRERPVTRRLGSSVWK